MANIKKVSDGGNVITLELSPWVGGCQHKRIIVDEQLACVECKDCKEKLNPLAILARFAKEETWMRRNNEEHRAKLAENDKRTRCKCQHCGKMTRISRT